MHKSVYQAHAWCLQKPEEGVGSLGTEVVSCWELNLGPPEDHLPSRIIAHCMVRLHCLNICFLMISGMLPTFGYGNKICYEHCVLDSVNHFRNAWSV